MGRIGCGDVDAEFVDAGGDGGGLSCSTRHRCRSQVAHTHPPARYAAKKNCSTKSRPTVRACFWLDQESGRCCK